MQVSSEVDSHYVSLFFVHSRSFIKDWVSIGKNARLSTEAAAGSLSFDMQCRHCEKVVMPLFPSQPLNILILYVAIYTCVYICTQHMYACVICSYLYCIWVSFVMLEGYQNTMDASHSPTRMHSLMYICLFILCTDTGCMNHF